jgi:hypothetical protein
MLEHKSLGFEHLLGDYLKAFFDYRNFSVVQSINFDRIYIDTNDSVAQLG